MLGALAMRFRRAHDANFAPEFLREQGRAEIVAAHVSGQDDCAPGRAEFFQPLRADQLVGELRSQDSVDRRLGDGPREIGERAKSAQIIHRARRAGQDDSEICHDRAPGQRREKEKENREEGDIHRIKKERQIDCGPVEILAPKDAFDGEAAEPLFCSRRPACRAVAVRRRVGDARLDIHSLFHAPHRGAATGAEAAVECVVVCLIASGAKISRRLISSARHQ